MVTEERGLQSSDNNAEARLKELQSPHSERPEEPNQAQGSGRLTLRLRTLAVSATFITVLTATLTVSSTAIIDNRRAGIDRRANAILAWRQNLRPGAEVPGAVLDGLDLSSVYAPKADISGASAEKTKFDRAGLVGVRFDSSLLRRASFRGASMAGASFVGADLTSATFVDADASDADFRFSKLAGADLRKVRLTNADFTGVDLSRTMLPTRQLISFCWDELTKFPLGYEPNRRLCRPPPERAPGALAENWRVTMASAPSDQDPRNWSEHTELVGGTEFSVLLEFNNVGRVPVSRVTLVIERDNPVISPVPGSVKLFNSNYVDGFTLSDDAIQLAGRQVNIQIGDYGGGSNAYVEIRYVIDSSVPVMRCGAHTFKLSGYATPSGRGSVAASTDLQWTAGLGC